MSGEKKGEPVQFDPSEMGNGNESSVMAWRIPHVKAMRADVAELRANVRDLAELQRIAARQVAIKRQLAVGK